MIGIWPQRLLANCGTWRSGGTPSRGNPAYWNGEIPWISAKTLRHFSVNSSGDRLSVNGAKNGTSLVQAGTLLFVVRGMSLKSEFRLGVTERTVAFNQDLKALVPSEDVDARFLGYSLKVREPEILSMVDEAGHGTGRLSTDRIGRLLVSIPPLPEQRAIAKALGDVDALIAAQQRLIAKKRAIKTSTMQSLLTGKQRLPGFGEGCGYRQTEIGLIPVDWEFADVGSQEPYVTSGSRGWAKYYAPEGSPFLRMTNVCRGTVELDLSELRLVALPPTETEGLRTAVKPGDLLLSITAEIGSVGYVEDTLPLPAYINQHLCLLRFEGHRICSKFAAYYFISSVGRTQFGKAADQGAKAGMNLNSVNSLLLLLPSLSEQRAIAQILTDMDSEITALEKRLAKTKDIKQGMMQELLTGRTRLL